MSQCGNKDSYLGIISFCWAFVIVVVAVIGLVYVVWIVVVAVIVIIDHVNLILKFGQN